MAFYKQSLNSPKANNIIAEMELVCLLSTIPESLSTSMQTNLESLTSNYYILDISFLRI